MSNCDGVVCYEIVSIQNITIRTMRKLGSFTFITLNGCFKGPEEDISWHKHTVSKEENDYAAEGAQSNSTLLFGRVTYEMMSSYWPTSQAKQQNPTVADGMNKSQKIVFSRTLKNATWANTTLIKNNLIDEVTKIKNSSGGNLTLLGSGSILAQLSEHRLIDEYQFMLDPVAIGNGTPVFSTIKNNLELELITTKTFKSGVILLSYRPK